MNDKGQLPDVSVVVVTYQSGEALARCLAALRGQTLAGSAEVILSDNASTDGAPQAAVAADPGLELIENGANLGFAAGNNRAAERARGRWLMLVNPDAYAEPDFVERMLAAARDFPNVRCFTARQKMAGDPARLDGLGDAMTVIGFPFRAGLGQPDPGPMEPAEVFSACGAAMMIDRALFLQMGGFDERFFCYCEDVDLGYRLQLRDEAVVLVPDAVVLHEGSLSTGGRRSDFSLYHGARNRLWTYVKNTPPLLLGVTLIPHLIATLALWARAVMTGYGAPVGRGIGDAIKGLPFMWTSRQTLQAARKVTSADIGKMMVRSLGDARARRGRMRPVSHSDTP